ncbi:MAG: mandelate racemase/muconate lactonizing enzyme family protein [Chloroflexota bacterium]
MKVASVKHYLVSPYGPDTLTGLQRHWQRKQWLFVKIETDEGIHGWGEAYTQATREQGIAQHIASLASYLVGWDPFHIRHFTRVAYEDLAGKRGAMDFFCALSALEHALWDIVGKRLGVPVYNLLGGPCRDRIRVYANGWDGGATGPDELARRAQDVVAQGFTALKFDPFPGPWRLFIPEEDERLAADNVRAIRQAVGPDIDILIEVHRRLAPMHAVRFASMVWDYRPFWYEEPVPADNVDALAEVRRAVRLPVVTGETLYTKAGFREVLQKRAADILNPDVANCGGILELREIASMAEPYYVAVSPHNYNSTTIALAATLQVSAAIPNFLITEYFVNFAERGRAIVTRPFVVEGGYIHVPDAPGLGLELDEAALARYPAQGFPPSAVRSVHDEGP